MEEKDKNNERKEKQKRIIELRTDAQPGTPYNSSEDFAEIAKEVKQQLGDLGDLSNKLSKLQQTGVTANNDNKLGN